MKKIFTIFLLISLISLPAVYAAEEEIGQRVLTYADDSSGRLSIVRYGKRDENSYLIHFEGFGDPWDGKVILHWYNDATNNKKYELRKKRGLGVRVYQTVVDSGRKTLIEGTIRPRVQLYLKSRRQPIELHLINQSRLSAEQIMDIYKNKID